MKYLLKIFILFSLHYCANTLCAQVKGVQYAIVYNSDSNLFDCYLYVSEGNARTVIERAQFNAQFSIVVPTGAKLKIVESYMPLIDNRDFKGIESMKWAISSKISSPAIRPEIDLYGVTPSLAPAGCYNQLNEGDLVKLFSVSVTDESLDINKVRIFNNESDPMSYEMGMQNGDFSNGFTIGGYHQIFEGIKKINLDEAN